MQHKPWPYNWNKEQTNSTDQHDMDELLLELRRTGDISVPDSVMQSHNMRMEHRLIGALLNKLGGEAEIQLDELYSFQGLQVSTGPQGKLQLRLNGARSSKPGSKVAVSNKQ